MICKNCGHELPENVNFCNACGSPLYQESETTLFENSAIPEAFVPDETTAVYFDETTAVYSDESEFASPDFEDYDAEQENGGKKKKMVLRSLLVAVPLVVALLVFLNWTAFAGFCVKTFGSDADYLQYVNSKRIDETADSIASFFSEFAYEPEQNVTAKMKFNISENLISLLSETTADDSATDILKWLNDVTLIADVVSDKSSASLNLAAEANDTVLLSGNLVTDLDSEKLYLSFPELAPGVLSSDIPTPDAPISLTELSVILEELQEALPSKDVFASLLKRYMSAVLNSLDNISSYEKNVSVNGLENECTVLRITFDEKSVFNLLKSVLEEAKTDKELKNCLKNLLKFAQKYNPDIPDIDLDSVYSEGIGTLIDQLNRSSAHARNEEYFTWCDYVVDHEVVGGAIEFEGEEVFRYITLHDGDNFTFELFIANGFEIRGSGKKQNNILSAKYTVSAMMPDYTDLLYIDVSDFNLTKLEKGNLCGKFRLTPSDTLLDTTDNSLKLLNPSLEVVSDQSENNQVLSLSVYSHDEILAGISVDCSQAQNPDVSIPDGQMFNAENPDDILHWVETIDLNNLINSLDRADAPFIIRDAIDDLQSTMNALKTPTEEVLPPAVSDPSAEDLPSSDVLIFSAH